MELEVPASVFEKGAITWGAVARAQYGNLSQTWLKMIENFLAVAQIAQVLSQRPHPQISDVRLTFTAIIDFDSWETNLRGQQYPVLTDMLGQLKYDSYLLRLTCTNPNLRHDGHINGQEDTFENMQRWINTQGARLAIAREQRGKRKAEQDSKEIEQPEDWIAYGLSNRLGDLPVFQNPAFHTLKHDPHAHQFVCIHNMTVTAWRSMLQEIYSMQAAVVKDGAVLTIGRDVLAVRANFTRRLARYLAWRKRSVHKDEPMVEHPQEDIVYDRWFRVPKDELGMDHHDQASLIFPYRGQTTWLLEVDKMRPELFRRTLFPWAAVVETQASAYPSLEKRLYSDRSVLASSLLAEDVPAGLLPPGISSLMGILSDEQRTTLNAYTCETAEQVNELYDHQVNRVSTRVGGFSMRTWRANNQRRTAEMKRQLQSEEEGLRKRWSDKRLAKHMAERTAELTRKVQCACIDEYVSELMSASNTCKSHRSIAQWYDQRKLQREATGQPLLMSFPRESKNPNLTSFEDRIAQEMEEIDTLEHVFTGHEVLLAMLMGALHVHLPYNLHFNVLQYSPMGSTGKSFLLDIILRTFIPGTCMMVSHFTPQFLTASDNPPDEYGAINYYDHQVVMQDELSSALFESASTGPSAAKSDMMAEMMKQVLTNGEYKHLSPDMNNSKPTADGEPTYRKRSEIHAIVRICFYAATNKSPETIAQPVQTRVVTQVSRTQKHSVRPDGKTVADKQTELENANESVKAACAVRRERWQRNQFMAMLIGAMIEGEVIGFDHGVDMRCSNDMFRWVSGLADQFNLHGFEVGRNKVIYNNMVQSLVLYDAIDKLFDIPGAPLQHQPWTFHQLILFLPYLCSVQEHSCIAFGMTRSKFENKSIDLTRDLLLTYAEKVQAEASQRKSTADIAENLMLLSDSLRRRGDDMGAERVDQKRNSLRVDLGDERVTIERKMLPKAASDGPDRFHYQLVISNPKVYSQLQDHNHKDKGGNYFGRQLAVRLEAQLGMRAMANGAEYPLDTSVYHNVMSMTNGVSKEPVRVYEAPDMAVGQGSDPVFTDERHGAQALQLTRHSIVLPLNYSSVQEELKRDQGCKNSLQTALRCVLSHRYATPRDCLYGEPYGHPFHLPHLYMLFTVKGVGDEPLHDPAPTLMLQMDDNSKTPLTMDINDHYVDTFNRSRLNQAYIENLHPSNNPGRLMKDLFLLRQCYHVITPYPFHEPRYFHAYFRATREIAKQSRQQAALDVDTTLTSYGKKRKPTALEKHIIQRHRKKPCKPKPTVVRSTPMYEDEQRLCALAQRFLALRRLPDPTLTNMQSYVAQAKKITLYSPVHWVLKDPHPRWQALDKVFTSLYEENVRFVYQCKEQLLNNKDTYCVVYDDNERYQPVNRVWQLEDCAIADRAEEAALMQLAA